MTTNSNIMMIHKAHMRTAHMRTALERKEYIHIYRKAGNFGGEFILADWRF